MPTTTLLALIATLSPAQDLLVQRIEEGDASVVDALVDSVCSKDQDERLDDAAQLITRLASVKNEAAESVVDQVRACAEEVPAPEPKRASMANVHERRDTRRQYSDRPRGIGSTEAFKSALVNAGIGGGFIAIAITGYASEVLMIIGAVVMSAALDVPLDLYMAPMLVSAGGGALVSTTVLLTGILVMGRAYDAAETL